MLQEAETRGSSAMVDWLYRIGFLVADDFLFFGGELFRDSMPLSDRL